MGEADKARAGEEDTTAIASARTVLNRSCPSLAVREHLAIHLIHPKYLH